MCCAGFCKPFSLLIASSYVLAGLAAVDIFVGLKSDVSDVDGIFTESKSFHAPGIAESSGRQSPCALPISLTHNAAARDKERGVPGRDRGLNLIDARAAEHFTTREPTDRGENSPRRKLSPWCLPAHFLKIPVT